MTGEKSYRNELWISSAETPVAHRAQRIIPSRLPTRSEPPVALITPHKPRTGSEPRRRQSTTSGPVAANSLTLPVHDASDLRRTLNPALVDRLLALADYVPQAEAELLKAVFAEGTSIASLARLGGRTERVMRARVRRVVRRVLEPRFMFCVTRMGTWPAARQRVAEHVVLHGRSLRECASAMRTTLHVVRRHVEAINALCAEADRSRRSA